MKRITHRLGQWRDAAQARTKALPPKAKKLAFNLCFYVGFVAGWVLAGAAIAARQDGATDWALALWLWALAFWLMALLTSDECELDKKNKEG